MHYFFTTLFSALHVIGVLSMMMMSSPASQPWRPRSSPPNNNSQTKRRSPHSSAAPSSYEVFGNNDGNAMSSSSPSTPTSPMMMTARRRSTTATSSFFWKFPSRKAFYLSIAFFPFVLIWQTYMAMQTVMISSQEHTVLEATTASSTALPNILLPRSKATLSKEKSQQQQQQWDNAKRRIQTNASPPHEQLQSSILHENLNLWKRENLVILFVGQRQDTGSGKHNKQQDDNDNNALWEGLTQQEPSKSRLWQVYPLQQQQQQQQQQPTRDNAALLLASNHTMLHLIDWNSLHRDCHVLEHMYANYMAATDQQQQQQLHQNHHLVYYDSSASAKVVTCPAVDRYFASTHHNNVVVVKSSVIVGRHWDFETSWIQPGKVLEQVTAGPRVIHASGFVSPRRIQQLQRVLQKEKKMATKALPFTSTEELPHALVYDLDRHVDVAHYGRKNFDTADYNFLRSTVSRHVVGMSKDNSLAKALQRPPRTLLRYMETDPNVTSTSSTSSTIMASLQSHRYQDHRLPPDAMVRSMLSASMIVVAQPDEWQDDGPLLQAMATGALVLTDALLVPPVGWRNGTHGIAYDNLESLRRLIRYYATHDDERRRIAHQGCRYVWEHATAPSRLEQIIFG